MTAEDEKKVVSINDHKKQKKPIKKYIKKGILGAAIVLSIILVVIGFSCNIKEIEVKGLTHYTEAEVKKAVKEHEYVNNSIFYFLKSKIMPPKLLPFIESFDVEVVNANKIRLLINEKKRAGCLLYNGKYVYFDKEGYALESHQTWYGDVPLVTGLKYKKVVMQEKIPVKKENVFTFLLELTINIDKYHLPIEQIYIDDSGNAKLITGELTVDLYNRKDIDIKIPELVGILKKLKGKSGTIDMKYFDEYQKITTFRPKKS